MSTFINEVEIQRDDSRENVGEKVCTEKRAGKVLAKYKLNLTLKSTQLTQLKNQKIIIEFRC